jgi:predicted ATPase
MGRRHLYVITGASGAGKSTLVAALGELGYATVPEAALAVLREQRRRGGDVLPSVDRVAFMEAVLARSVDDHAMASTLEAPVFFDRGIPEWLRFLDPGHAHCQAAAQRRYAATVFLAEPWPEIYVRDHERQASFEQAARSYEATVAAYVQAGYEMRVVPKASVKERAAYILTQTGLSPDNAVTPKPLRGSA